MGETEESMVLWERDGGVGRVTLNRPSSLNAWTIPFGRELVRTLTVEATERSVRAVLLTGAGRGFSSGVDLRAGFEIADDGMPDVRSELVGVYHPVITAVRALEKPVVGIGASLALACDLVLAAESAFFQLAFANIGLMPDGGSTALLPAAIGKARAFELSLLAERLSPARALEWGLINAVHPDESLPTEAGALTERLAAGPTRSYAGTKRALNRSLFGDLDGQLGLEAELQHELARTRDFTEGVMAFAQKRPAAFEGA